MNTSRLEQIRKIKSLKQQDLADYIGITVQSYRNLLKSRDFRISHLEKAAELFNVDVCLFFKKDTDTKKIIGDKNTVAVNSQNSNNKSDADCSVYIKEIEYLKKQIKDKETIINLLNERK